MRKIDAHVHVFKYGEHWPEWAAKKWVEEESSITKGSPIHWVTGKQLRPEDFNAPYDWAIEVMDKSGVEQAFLLGQYIKHLDIIVPTNYLVEALEKYPNRFYGFCAPDPLGGSKSVEELEWAITEKGFTGLKLLPSYHDLHPFDEILWPIYKKANALRIPIVIHTGSGPLPQNKLRWQDPYAFEDLLIEFSEINICFGHTGFHRVLDVLMMMRKYKNLYGDLAYWNMFPLDFIARWLVLAKKLEVLDRLMWGTDFPRLDPKIDSEYYKEIPTYTRRHDLQPEITEEDLSILFSENALRFIKKK